MKALRWIVLGLAVVLLLVAATTAWLVGTASGAGVALKLARGRLPGELEVGRVEGSLLGPLVLEQVEYRPPDGGAPLRLVRAEFDLAARELLRRRVDLLRASLDGLRMTLPEEASDTPEPARIIVPPLRLPELRAPWPIELRAFEATDLRIDRAGKPILQVDRVEATARWAGDAIEIDRLEARGPQGTAELRARLVSGDAPHLHAQGKVDWRIGDRLLSAELTASTEDARLVLETRLASPFLASGKASLDPRPQRWTLAVEVPEFDPRGPLLSPQAGLKELAVRLDAEGVAGAARVSGTFKLNGETIHLDSLEAKLEPETVRVATLVARLNDGPGTARAEGSIQWVPGQPEFDLQVALKGLALPPAWTRQALEASGDFRAKGSTSSFLAAGELQLGPPGRASRIGFSLRGTPAEIQLEPLRVLQPDGHLGLRGKVQFQPLRWDLAAEAERFDPGDYFSDWPGRLTGNLRSAGALEKDGPLFEVVVDRLAGRLRNRPILGSGNIAFSPAAWLKGELRLESGEARVRIRSAEEGATPTAQVELALPALQDWLPRARGSFQARALLRGKWPDIGISGEASGRDLAFGAARVEALEVVADLPHLRRPAGRLRVDLRQAELAGLSFQDLQVAGSGDEQAHELSLRATGEPLRASLKLAGKMVGTRWSGDLQSLRFRWAGLPELTLQEPAALAAGRDGTWEFSRASFVGGDLRFALAGSRSAAGEIVAEARLQELPLAVIGEFVPGGLPTRVEGTITAEAKVRREASGAISGEARVASPSATVAVPREGQPPGAAPIELVLYEDLRIEASSDGTEGQATLQATLASKGTLQANLALGSLREGDARATGTIEAALPTLEPLAALLPQFPGLAGRVDARLEVAGPWRRPEITGRVDAADLRAEIPRLGLRLREGNLHAEPAPDRAIKISGAIRSGDGRVALDGTWKPGRDLRATLQGERFLAADLPAARVLVTPDLTLLYGSSGITLKGTAQIPEAAVNLEQLPQGRAQRRSRDVVVIDRPEEARQRQALPLQAEVAVELGSAVNVTGFGLDAKLGGRITLVERPGTPTTASGEVSVAGTYEGYGQDLTITRGRVLYAGTPIGDPQLDISAERELEEVTAGVRISGTARMPEVHVFSRPDMGQADALSYLVTGKPLSGVASQSESDLLNSAARSLGTAAGSLLAERIGRRLGIDEVGIEESDMIEGGVFTIGEYLSPRLYVAYGVGLFEPGDLVTLRYELSETLNLRAVRGPDETRAGVEYKVER